ncbi:hypothetical protein EYF80_062350 [Liparis tanakae]|uniref:Uncharacterized protein n=1 Tax=Liparis tanakae TaxID=230148 RepID=A0A4Z2EFL4_9TELE|nr:hypothetical protein EYF80_062350 [Liparis tanakae]
MKKNEKGKEKKKKEKKMEEKEKMKEKEEYEGGEEEEEASVLTASVGSESARGPRDSSRSATYRTLGFSLEAMVERRNEREERRRRRGGEEEKRTAPGRRSHQNSGKDGGINY